MTDCIHIAGLTAHQISGAVLIIESKILLQQLAIHLVAHAVQDALGAHLKKNLRKETAKSLHNDRSEQKGDQIRQHPGLSSIDDIIDDHTGNIRVDQRCYGEDRHKHKSPEHLPLVLPQKAVKPLYWGHFKLPPFSFHYLFLQ